MTATDLARAVVTALVEGGVTEVVVCPGSRNAPLSFAAYDAAAAGLLRLHTRVDERTAGFLALGLTRNHHRAAVVCTSGTAVANLHPALLEAVHAGLPLVVVTADRPARLGGTSANQTTDQVGIFGPMVPTVDLETEVPALEREGPTHWNVRLDEPLLPPPDPWRPEVVRPRTAVPVFETVARLDLGPATVVVAGDDAGPKARVLAERAGWPLLAEPSSGARTGPNALRCYRLLLGPAADSPLAQRVERVVVAGHPTLSRPVARLLARPDVEVVDLVEPGRRFARPFPVARELPRGEPSGDQQADDPAWLAAWQEADRDVAARLDRLLREQPGLTAYDVAGAVSRALPPGGLLVVGASNPIRDLDLMARAHPVGEHRKVVANRGLAGIDGTVSTAVGAALARRPGERNLALMGDVTFLHDATGLVLGPDEPSPDLTIVVTNDDGGSIFATLEQGGAAYADRFERLFATPHGVDLASLCAATRTPHWRVESLPELEQALSSPNGGIEVVEARVPRHDRRALDEQIRTLATDAVAGPARP